MRRMVNLTDILNREFGPLKNFIFIDLYIWFDKVRLVKLPVRYLFNRRGEEKERRE